MVFAKLDWNHARKQLQEHVLLRRKKAERKYTVKSYLHIITWVNLKKFGMLDGKIPQHSASPLFPLQN